MWFDSQKRESEKDFKGTINQKAQDNTDLYNDYKINDKHRKAAREAFFNCINNTENDPTSYLDNWEAFTQHQLDQLRGDEVGVLPRRDIKIKEHEQTLIEIEAFRNPPKKWTQILYENNPRLKDHMERVENLEKIIEIMSGDLEGRYEEFQKGASLDLEEFKPYLSSLVKILDIMRCLNPATLAGDDQNTVIVKTEEFMQKGNRYNDIRAGYLTEQKNRQLKNEVEQKRMAYESQWEAMGAQLTEQKRQEEEAQYEKALADYLTKQRRA